jgi:AcrR family transcriptional regulator
MKLRPLRERLRESTWAAILDAAEDVAASEGLPSASLQAVARRAGVAVGTIYNYFHDRQELFAALFARRREELFDYIESEAKRHAGGSFDEQLTAFVRAVFTHFDARRTFLRIALEAEQMRPAVVKGNDGKRRPAIHQLQMHAERILRVGAREKRVKEDRSNVHAMVLVSILKGVLIMRVDSEAPLAAETENVVSLFLHGVAR